MKYPEAGQSTLFCQNRHLHETTFYQYQTTDDDAFMRPVVGTLQRVDDYDVSGEVPPLWNDPFYRKIAQIIITTFTMPSFRRGVVAFDLGRKVVCPCVQ